jgi:hypothetical protein
MIMVQVNKVPKIPAEMKVPGLFLFLLAIQAISTYWSETDLIPLIRYNVGIFEVNAAILSILTFAYFLKHSVPVHSHPLIMVLGFWFVATLLSLVYARGDTFIISVAAVVITLFQFVFTLVFFNILSHFRSALPFILRWIMIAATLAALWVLIDQLSQPGNYSAAGPFRGRSHVGIYMMGSFWMILMFRFWPGIKLWEKVLTYPAMALVLYGVAASLRQSVYTAMIVGVVGLTFSFVILRGWERFKISQVMLLMIGVIAALFLIGGQYLSSLALFQREAIGLESRLSIAFASEGDPEFDESFDAKQRKGAIQAFFDHPVLGIGWMGFYHSPYSPTGHELHSSTLRFVAELGIFGIIIYASILFLVFSRSIRLFLMARKTPYQIPAYIMLVGFTAEAISHYYNRMFTDRPYWFMLVVLLTFEAYVRHVVVAQPKPAVVQPADVPFPATAPSRL